MSDLARKVRLPFTKRRTAAKAVLLTLADDARDDGSSAYPSMQTIALESAVSIKTADRCLLDLQEHGLISQQAPPRQHMPRTWRLHVERLRELVNGEDLRKVDAAWPSFSARHHRADLDAAQVGTFEFSGRQIDHPDRQIEASARHHSADERTTGVPTEENGAASPRAPARVNTPPQQRNGRHAANAGVGRRKAS